MASPNAFAQSHNGHSSPTNGESRPAKRVRLAEDAIAAIQEQTTQSDVSLEVDHMVLDYIAYQTTETCLLSRDLDRANGHFQSLAASLPMSETFLSIFKTRHPDYEPDAELHFRLLLLKLTALFTQRFTLNPSTPSREELRILRLSNRDRARSWLENVEDGKLPSSDTMAFDEQLPTPDDILEQNRARVLRDLDLPAENHLYEDAFYGTPSCVQLLDLIPLFMQLSAARNTMSGSSMSEYLMKFASEMMLQACLEQYAVCGVYGTGALEEAFAWGYLPNTSGTSEAGLDAINSMFEDEDYEVEVNGWTETKLSFLKLLLPDSDADQDDQPPSAPHQDNLQSRLEHLITQYPIKKFEMAMLEFLSALADSIPRPVLVQLESGQLDGMTKQETSEFLQDCGLGLASFFEEPAGFK